jgi:hypothetical protein
VFVPDYSWRETDKWIVFPWSAEPPVMVPTGTAPTSHSDASGPARVGPMGRAE